MLKTAISRKEKGEARLPLARKRKRYHETKNISEEQQGGGKEVKVWACSLSQKKSREIAEEEGS